MNRSLLITTSLCLTISTTPCLGESPWPSLSSHPRRNPFKPVETTPTPRPLTAVPPLERYPINSLTLTAIITNAAGERYASVENPEGIGYKVEKGTAIGDAQARVVEISIRGIIVEESGPDGTRTREIPLRVER